MDEPGMSLFSTPPRYEHPSFLARSRRIFGQFVYLVLVLLSAGLGSLAGLVFVYSSDLPRVE